MTPLRQRFIDDLRLRNYAARTIESYVSQVVYFAKHFGRSPDLLGPEEVRAYQLHMLQQRVSWSRFNQAVSALRLLYGITLGRPELLPTIPYGKRPKVLPSVLAPEEVLRLIDAAETPRDRVFVQTGYGGGLGLIHRDLKPHNLMRTSDGTVKILDFGLAVLVDANRGEHGLTAENAVLGTPDYIAPEQAEDSRHADVRSDIYSLGCTLYQLLTGRVPFPGDSVLRKLDAHRTQKPDSIRKIRPEVHPALAEVVAKMMAKKPADRFQTPSEVAAAVAPFATGAVPVRNRGKLRLAAAALPTQKSVTVPKKNCVTLPSSRCKTTSGWIFRPGPNTSEFLLLGMTASCWSLSLMH
jgi:serine/threonine protein kinase